MDGFHFVRLNKNFSWSEESFLDYEEQNSTPLERPRKKGKAAKTRNVIRCCRKLFKLKKCSEHRDEPKTLSNATEDREESVFLVDNKELDVVKNRRGECSRTVKMNAEKRRSRSEGYFPSDEDTYQTNQRFYRLRGRRRMGTCKELERATLNDCTGTVLKCRKELVLQCRMKEFGIW